VKDQELEIARCAEILSGCGELLLVGGQAVGITTAAFRRRGVRVDTREAQDVAGAGRGTEDIDFAIRAGRFDDAAGALLRAGFDRKEMKTRFFSGATVVDVLEADPGAVPGPVDQGASPWSIPAPAGESVTVTLGPEGTRVSIPTIAVLVAMKSQSWASRSALRPEKKGTDLADIASLALCERVRPSGARESFTRWAPQVEARVFYVFREVRARFESPEADGTRAFVKVVREFAGAPWSADDEIRTAAHASDAVRSLLADFREK